MIQKIKAYSPVIHRDFIWVADYMDGTDLHEIEGNGKVHLFHEIDKSKLTQFGMVGRGIRLFYSAATGVFFLDGRIIEFYLRCNDAIHPLTSSFIASYQDAISFKQAEVDMNPFTGEQSEHRIIQYTFGYKTRIETEDTTISFKPMFHLVYGKPSVMKIWIVSQKAQNAELVIVRNKEEVAHIPVSFEPGIGQELEWVVC